MTPDDAFIRDYGEELVSYLEEISPLNVGSYPEAVRRWWHALQQYREKPDAGANPGTAPIRREKFAGSV